MPILQELGQKVREHLFKIVIGGASAASLALLVFAHEKIKEVVDGYIRAVVRQELSGETSKHIGALISGSAKLDRDRIFHSIYVYLPKNSRGELHVNVPSLEIVLQDRLLKGQSLKSNADIMTVSINGHVISRINEIGNYVIPLEDGRKVIPSPKEGQAPIAQTIQGQLTELYEVTLQLTQAAALEANVVPVKYMALVMPVMKLGADQ